jgi:deoxyribonuclease V
MNKYHHAWKMSIDQARETQSDLAKKITIKPLPENLSTIAGFDVSYQNKENVLIAGMVVLAYPSLERIESHHIKDKINFPYIPGYLSFREAPALLKLIESYAKDVDIFIFDGHGVAHPRGLGIASHIGVLTGIASIGCAKKRLVGTYSPPGLKKGDTSDLEYKGEVVARVICTRENIKPVFVSIGNNVSLDDAATLVLRCCTQYKLPEPTRLAHQLVTRAKQNIN